MVVVAQTRSSGPLDPSLEKLRRGYERLLARDFDAAVALLSDPQLQKQTVLGDYAVWFRARALSAAGRHEEAEREYLRIATINPTSLLVDDARIDAAESAIKRGAYGAAIDYLKPALAVDDGQALKLKADALEKLGRTDDSIVALRRLYFYAPDSQAASEVPSRLTSLGSSVLPVNAAEQKARADRLYDEELWVLSAQAYDLLTRQFPAAQSDEVWLKAGISNYRMNSHAAAIDALSRVRSRTPKDRAEVLYFTGLAQFALKRSDVATATLGELMRTPGADARTAQLLYEFGRASDKASIIGQAHSYFRQLVDKYPKTEVASDAHFWLAWNAHRTKTYAQASQLLLEHLSDYGDCH